MNAKQAADLKGKYALFQIGDQIFDSYLTEVSPSGSYVYIGGNWQPIANVTFVETLPEPPALAPGNILPVKPDQSAELEAAVQATLKLQEQNTILNEQLGNARREIVALKQALTEDKPVPAVAPAADAPATLTFPTSQP